MKYKAALLALAALAVILAVSPRVMAAATRSAVGFVAEAVSGNMFEIESSRIALERSRNDSVKEFAQRMIDDHAKTGAEMKAALITAGMEIPEGDGLNEKHQKILEKLTDADSSRFDTDYISAQIDAHNEAIELFKGYAESGDQPDLQQFAMHTLPILQSHRDHLQGFRFSQ